MKKVLVTGSTGFVGANLARRLVQDGHNVHLLVRSEHNPWRIVDLLPHVRIHEVELLDFESLKAIVFQVAPDWIFHLAAYGAYSHQTDLFKIVNTNYLGTVNLLEACLIKGFESFVNTGSSSEYGFKNHPTCETDWLDPNSYYAVAKSSATMHCRYSAKKFGMHIPTLRLFNIYGPYEDPTRLIPTLIMKGLKKKFPPLVDPNIARDLTYVGDVVDVYLKVATTKSEEMGAVYNVGTGIQTTLGELVSLAKSIFHITEDPKWSTMPNRTWDTTVWLSNNEKIKKEIGWSPFYTLEQGLNLTIDWFRESQERQQFYTRQQG